MNLQQINELSFSLLEYIHQIFPDSCYVEPGENIYRKLQLNENQFIQIEYNPKGLPIYIEPVLNSNVLYEFDLSRVIQNNGCFYSWYLPIPSRTTNKMILNDFGLAPGMIPLQIYKVMREQQKEVKNTDMPSLTKSGYEFIFNYDKENLYSRALEFISFIFSWYLNNAQQ